MNLVAKETKKIVLDGTELEVSGLLITNEDSTKEFEIESVMYNNNNITSLLESLDAFYMNSRLSSLRDPDKKVLDIWDEIERLILQ